MIAFNKVQDVYHTLLRLYTILKVYQSESMPEKALYIVDFLTCFPQHASNIRKRQFKFLKGLPADIDYRGNIQSHFYLLNRTQLAAIRLMQAKNVVSIELGKVYVKNTLQVLDTPLDETIIQLLKTIKEIGYEDLNSSLRIYEDRYDTSN